MVFEAKIPAFSHPIAFEPIENFTRCVKDASFTTFFVIADKNTCQFAKRLNLEAEIIEVPCGEYAKSLETTRTAYQKLEKSYASRRSTLLIGVGGGAVCDLTGFVAMTFMRGISYALIPTSLVAIVDAAIGSKVGINGPNGKKNLIGGFYAPHVVHIDLDVLNTLPQREYLSAFAEIIKTACIANDEGGLTNYLEENANKLIDRSSEELMHVVKTSIGIKKKYVEPDLMEVNLDRMLNLGHALAHAIESTARYSLLHGECVAMGIAQSCRIGVSRGLCSSAFAQRILRLFKAFSLPTALPADLRYDALKAAIETIQCVRDGNLREVIPVSPGQSIILHDARVDEILDQNGALL